jgi:voltage-gated potassium channel
MADYKVDQLRRIPIFAACSKPELRILARNTDEIDFPAGRTLIVQGAPNHTFFLLLQGEVQVDVAGLPPQRLGPGDFFGEITMIAPGPATATVVTTAPSLTLVMSHAQFRTAIKANELIALRVMKVMAERLRRINLAEGFG